MRNVYIPELSYSHRLEDRTETEKEKKASPFRVFVLVNRMLRNAAALRSTRGFCESFLKRRVLAASLALSFAVKDKKNTLGDVNIQFKCLCGRQPLEFSGCFANLERY